jgi:hypothetical protein
MHLLLCTETFSCLKNVGFHVVVNFLVMWEAPLIVEQLSSPRVAPQQMTFATRYCKPIVARQDKFDNLLLEKCGVASVGNGTVQGSDEVLCGSHSTRQIQRFTVYEP